MVLVRVAESQTGETWPSLRADLGRQVLGAFESKQGKFQYVSRPTIAQIAAYKACHVDLPPKIYAMSAPGAG